MVSTRASGGCKDHVTHLLFRDRKECEKCSEALGGASEVAHWVNMLLPSVMT